MLTYFKNVPTMRTWQRKNRVKQKVQPATIQSH